MYTMITSMGKADGLEAKQTTEIKQTLPGLVWVVGLWMAYFSPLVSVFCNVVILLYNEKHIYFYRKECP